MAHFDADYVPRSAMAIFAHPDDAEFTVAGTLAKWARGGCAVTLVLITSGNVGTHDPRHTRKTIASARERESREAARILGLSAPVFLRHDDCAVAPTIALRRELVRQIRRRRPEVLVCGDPRALFYGDRYINHPDHRAAAEVALDAAFPCAEMELLWPEAGRPHKVSAVYVASTEEPNCRIDIGGTIDAKIAALKAHESQMEGWDPSPLIRGWAEQEARGEARSGRRLNPPRTTPAGRRRRPRYAEAFRVMKLHEDEKPES